jgi:spoIIIJ-associated protein
MNDTITTTTQLTQELLNRLQVEGTAGVTEVEGGLLITIETQEPGILIGYHGRNLESFQLVLGQMLYKALGVWTRITVSVGDYRERREKQLQELAASAAERVTNTQEPVILSDLTPAERRIVHMALQDHATVISESEGEGRNRRLVVKPRA